ncbi:MAG: metal ABC transporter permease, partial [Negativicutes bacterium]|nr:metal ABC transporter permease [Negativicutes bacterium]
MGEISWLPLWLRHDFMQNGLLAVVLIAPALAMLGTAVVNNRLAFFSDALGHSAYTGVALGVLLAGWGPQAGLFGFSLLFALLVIAVKNRSRLSPDTVIGIFSSTAIALGLVLMSRGGGFNRFSTYLIGDLLSVGKADLWGLAVLLA